MKRRKFIKTTAIGSAAAVSIGSSFQAGISSSPLPTIKDPRNLYGSLEAVMEDIRANNPQDLSLSTWRKNNPQSNFEQWQSAARECLMQGLNYHPGSLNLSPEVIEKQDHKDFILERVCFNTAPWHRLEAYFLLPKGVRHPVPAIVALHAWGGPMCFGKDRIVNGGRDHPILVKHRQEYYEGAYLAEEYVKRGYAVIVIDAHHFGNRVPKGINEIPNEFDPFSLSEKEFQQVDDKVRSLLYYGVRQLNWAGTTWAGLNYFDDSRCVDYLLSRPEVDGERIGVTGLSGGGWRTNILAALDNRIKASVSVGWMTTGDMQQHYNVAGAIGTFCLLPGVWNRLDIPDLAAMSAPNACMVVVGTEDILFPTEGKMRAKDQIQAAFNWAGMPDRHFFYSPKAVHCYNRDIQEKALTWFDKHLHP